MRWLSLVVAFPVAPYIVRHLCLLTAAQTPPFGESTLSSGLMQLEYCIIGSSASQILHGCTEYLETKDLETKAGMVHNLAAMASQFQSDVTEFLDLIESRRPLMAHENELRDISVRMTLNVQDCDWPPKTMDQSPAKIKSGHDSKERNSTAENLGTRDGTGLIML